LRMIRPSLLFLFIFIAGTFTALAVAQQAEFTPAGPASIMPDAPSPAQPSQTAPPKPSSVTQSEVGQQTRRILGIVPNFRSVSVDQKLPPLPPREKFKLMREDSFDYSDFIYVGILAGVAQASSSYPEFHSGAPAFARYYWHNMADTVDGNLMTEYLYPVALKEDPRYYTLGRGGFVKRTGYSISCLFWNRTDRGGMAPNFSEIVGNGSAAGISNFYYPRQERTWTKTGQRWVAQVGLDGFSNIIKEFWPDLNARFFHNKY
jgi:hypothetical protein